MENIAKILISELEKVIKGRSDTIKLVVTGLISGGHVLIEDYPGSGKTTLAKTLGNLIECKISPSIVPFRRIQFTPDLLPSDVLGVNIFDPKSATFHFQHGPIFANIVLADEINRTGPKVQAAFLECMAEKQVTIDNTTYPLDELFFVIGTQNPIDMAGTYPLPLVQLDRFLLKIPMNYVDRERELDIVTNSEIISKNVAETSPKVKKEDLLAARSKSLAATIHPKIIEAIVELCQTTRENKLLTYGASTRAAILFKRALLAYAFCEDRDYVTPDDFKNLAKYALFHRLKFSPQAGDPHNAFQQLVNVQVEKLERSNL